VVGRLRATEPGHDAAGDGLAVAGDLLGVGAGAELRCEPAGDVGEPAGEAVGDEAADGEADGIESVTVGDAVGTADGDGVVDAVGEAEALGTAEARGSGVRV
jgi:hypothetical protein